LNHSQLRQRNEACGEVGLGVSARIIALEEEGVRAWVELG